MYKAVTQIVTDAGEIPTGVTFVPEDYDLPLDEVERLMRVGAVTELEVDPVDADDSAVETKDRTRQSRKRTK
jgi:hypothetical protein